MIVASIVGLVLWEAHADQIIQAAYNGRSLPLVNKYVGIHKSIDPANRTLEYFLRIGNPVVPRLLGVLIAMQTLMLVGMRYGRSVVSNFFSETTHPVNLGVFRIVLFAALIFYVDVPQVIQFSGFPSELRVAPIGIGWLIDILPITPAWATVATYLFLLACISALLGFFPRTSAAFSVILGFYVLGIPQFFGKIDHYHHLLWFAAILAASPCGDALSIDSFIASRKRTPGTPLGPSLSYALPLKFVMLLMGTIYFFAGVWKYVIGGFEWAAGDTMRYMLYAQWFRLDWMPAFRIDHYPLLYMSAGIGVMIFELGFLILILFPHFRKFAVIAGILFHLSVYLFAHINFWTLAVCYVVFLDFDRVHQKLKNTIQKKADAISSIRQSALVTRHSFQAKPVIIVGGSLLAINILCGLTLIDSWPFAVYPTFAGVQEKYLQSLTISFINPDGTSTEIIPYKERSFQSKMHPSRLIGLCTQVLWAKDSIEAEKRGTALLTVLAESDKRLAEAKSITMFKDICSVIPEERNENPVRRELLIKVER